MKLKVLDLFSGIGGFSLGLEITGGFETVAFCEIEPYCQKVLNKHWPNVPVYENVRELTETRLDRDGIRPDVITGGFPCQDISVAGKGAGIEGERSGLWSELARIISELQPRYAILENVTNLISGDRGRWFGRVLGDLAEIGYDAEWHCIPASAIGAHHHRDRVWIIAYPSIGRVRVNAGAGSSASSEWEELQQENGQTLPDDTESLCKVLAHTCEISEFGDSGSKTILADSESERWEGLSNNKKQPRKAQLFSRRHFASESKRIRESTWLSESGVGRVANGIPRRMDRLKGLGNAIVPQIAMRIGLCIKEAEKTPSQKTEGFSNK